MSGQGYKRTNFEEDDYTSNGGTPPPADFTHSVDFRGSDVRAIVARAVLDFFFTSYHFYIAVEVLAVCVKDGQIKTASE